MTRSYSISGTLTRHLASSQSLGKSGGQWVLGAMGWGTILRAMQRSQEEGHSLSHVFANPELEVNDINHQMQSPTPNQGAICRWWLLEKDSASFMARHLHVNHTPGRRMLRSGWPTQKGPHAFFFCLLCFREKNPWGCVCKGEAGGGERRWLKYVVWKVFLIKNN